MELSELEHWPRVQLPQAVWREILMNTLVEFVHRVQWKCDSGFFEHFPSNVSLWSSIFVVLQLSRQSAVTIKEAKGKSGSYLV